MSIKVIIAQLNLMVGDINSNSQRIISSIQESAQRGADIVLFPELTLCSYPPEDLLFRSRFHDQIEHALDEIIKYTDDIHVLVGHPLKDGEKIYNACSLVYKNKIRQTYFKQHLPNYGVFDEKRYFVEGNKPGLFEINGIPVANTICEDIWVPGPTKDAADKGARILFNINASPYHRNKLTERENIIRQRARETGMHIVYANLVGGQDELVFDGNSMVVDQNGELLFHAPPFEEGLFECEIDLDKKTGAAYQKAEYSEEASIYQAVTLGTRDYVQKNKFSGAIVGLSGGIDSALTLCIAVDALGAENVEAISMPSRYTADMSNEDASEQARMLGVRSEVISIEEPFETFLGVLQPRFQDLPVDITEENIQARCRGLILMAVSNKTGKLVLTTGNKSEMAVGYATLYGDMCGGFAPLKDVWKTTAYRLARWRNTISPAIPERVITRPPSAELRPDQLDMDSLPDYETLDPILELYIEFDNHPQQIIKKGYNESDINRVIKLVDKNEYKRRQAAPGVRITNRAFGRDRRYPITSGYDEKN